jgi:hypothetical protein
MVGSTLAKPGRGGTRRPPAARPCLLPTVRRRPRDCHSILQRLDEDNGSSWLAIPTRAYMLLNYITIDNNNNNNVH